MEVVAGGPGSPEGYSVSRELARVAKEYNLETVYGPDRTGDIVGFAEKLFTDYEVDEQQLEDLLKEETELEEDLYFLEILSIAERWQRALGNDNQSELQRLKFSFENMMLFADDPFDCKTLEDLVGSPDDFVLKCLLVSRKLERAISGNYKDGEKPEDMQFLGDINFLDPNYYPAKVRKGFVDLLKTDGVAIEEQEINGEAVKIVRIPVTIAQFKEKLDVEATAWREQNAIIIPEGTSPETTDHEIRHLFHDLPINLGPMLHEALTDYCDLPPDIDVGQTQKKAFAIYALSMLGRKIDIDRFDKSELESITGPDWDCLEGEFSDAISGEEFWSKVDSLNANLQDLMNKIRSKIFLESLMEVAPSLSELAEELEKPILFTKRQETSAYKNIIRELIENSGLFLISQLRLTDNQLRQNREEFVDFSGGIALSYVTALDAAKKIGRIIAEENSEAKNTILDEIADEVRVLIDPQSSFSPPLIKDDEESKVEVLKAGSNYTDHHSVLGISLYNLLPEFSKEIRPIIYAIQLLKRRDEILSSCPQAEETLTILGRNFECYSKTAAAFNEFFVIPDGLLAS